MVAVRLLLASDGEDALPPPLLEPLPLEIEVDAVSGSISMFLAALWRYIGE